MKREEFYIVAAPIFATYLGVTSGNEALRYTAFNTAELDEQESRRLFVASLTPSPSTKFVEDGEEISRLFGYALAQEEAGVDRDVLVHTFLESVKAIAVSKTEARAEMYQSTTSALGALYLTPLFLLFLWAVGVFTVDPTVLYVVVFAVAAAVGAVALAATPRDLDFWKTYGPSLPLGAAVFIAAATFWPPAGFFALGVATYAWLAANGRLWWFSIRKEVPPLLRSVAAMLKEGAPPDLIMARLSGKFRLASRIAYGYFIPSKYFVMAKSMYRAITEAGGTAAIKAVEYIQAIVDVEMASVRKMLKLAVAYFGLYAVAALILASAVSTAVRSMGESAALNPLFVPPPYEEVKSTLSNAMAVIVASYVAVFLAPLGIHTPSTLGGVAGAATHLLLLAVL